MSESTVTKSNVFKEDMALATGGTGAAETGLRRTSTGGTVTLTKFDASHIKFRALALSLDDLVDGGQDVTIKPLNIDAGGTLTVAGAATLSALTPAGYVKNSAAGLLSTGAIAAADLPSAIDAAKIADGSVSNAEFQYLNGVTSAIQTQITQNTPAGCIMDWPTETPPAGWLECDGAAVSRTTYADLFAVLGSMYGPGDGSTTFNLPDLRGKFRRGWAHGQATDPNRASRTDRGDGTTGDHVGTKQADEFKSHTHTMGNYVNANAGLLWNIGGGSILGIYNTESNPTGGNETRPVNINMMPIIKY